LREILAGKVVISMANALIREGREMLALIPPRGSVAAAAQSALPDSLVAAAFHHLPASEMEDLESGLEADVLVCSDYPEATVVTESLIDVMRGLRPLNAGSLNQAAAIEAFTAVCITLNMRHKAHSTLRIAGI
jgi:NADPH-dependent F420 reductase